MQSSGVTLPDRRVLSYGERGDPSGWPVLYFHGALGYRWEWPGAEADLSGLRWFSLERPGFGLSTVQKGRTLLGWADDVRWWADHVGLQQFSIAAWSSGCPHALACGYALADRVREMHLMACPTPQLRSYGCGLRIRGSMWMARRAPAAFRAGVRTFSASGRVFNAAVRVEISTEQMELLRDAHFVRGLQGDHASALAQGPAGFVEDLALCGRRWEFPLRGVQAPVVLWNGDRDGLVKRKAALWLRDILPDAQLRWARGGTHFLPFTHEARVLEGIKRGRDPVAAHTPAE